MSNEIERDSDISYASEACAVRLTDAAGNYLNTCGDTANTECDGCGKPICPAHSVELPSAERINGIPRTIICTRCHALQFVDAATVEVAVLAMKTGKSALSVKRKEVA